MTAQVGQAGVGPGVERGESAGAEAEPAGEGQPGQVRQPGTVEAARAAELAQPSGAAQSGEVVEAVRATGAGTEVPRRAEPVEAGPGGEAREVAPSREVPADALRIRQRTGATARTVAAGPLVLVGGVDR